MNTSTKSPERLIRIKEVMKLTGLGRSTVWQYAKTGKLPKPIKISDRYTAWRLSEIEAWMAEKIEAAQGA
ncbi:helix-turn-helix transcriptional regulator [Hydrogenimonas sp.]